MFRSISKQHVMFKKKQLVNMRCLMKKQPVSSFWYSRFLVFQTGKEYVEDDTRVESITTST